jgi:hypothetical protein
MELGPYQYVLEFQTERLNARQDCLSSTSCDPREKGSEGNTRMQLTHPCPPQYGTLAIEPKLEDAAFEEPLNCARGPLAKVLRLDRPEIDQRKEVEYFSKTFY